MIFFIIISSYNILYIYIISSLKLQLFINKQCGFTQTNKEFSYNTLNHFQTF